MPTYQQFVKTHLAKMKGSSLSQTEKIQHIAKLWKQHKGAGLPVTGGKVSKAKKKTPMKEGEGLAMTGGKVKKNPKGKKGGKLEEPIILKGGMVLHPAMLGGAWYDDLWRGFKMPFEAIGKVAKVVEPVAKIASFLL